MSRISPYGGRQITISVRNPCNFNCYYCIGRNHDQKMVRFNFKAIEMHYEMLNDFIVTVLECGTGEPTLHPQIKELMALVLKYGPLFLPTNNSLHPKYWLPSHHVNRLDILASLHPENETNINRFLDHLLYLKDQGARVRVSFVCHPTRFYKKDFYVEFFNRHNIPTNLVPYSGTYRNTEYPSSYSEQERNELGNELPKVWWAELPFEATWRNFRDIPCLAGFIDSYLKPTGELTRCLYDNQPLEEFFDTPKPCRVTHCGCGFLLSELNNRGNSYWNLWRRFCGEELLPESEEDLSTMFEKMRGIYLSLKARYENRNERFVMNSPFDWNPFDNLEGIDSIVQELFKKKRSIDFFGIGTLFNCLANSPSFKKELVGNLFDNSPKKQGQRILERTIHPFKNFPKEKISKTVLLSVQWPEKIWPLITDLINENGTDIYYLEIENGSKLKLKKK